MKKLRHKLYVRREGRVSGPYPAGLVSRYILLGRIRRDDEVSSDRIDWFRVGDVKALIPGVMREVDNHPHDPEVLSRLQSARRWADERCLPRDPLEEGAQRRRVDCEERARAEVRRAGSESRARNYLVLSIIVAAVVALPFILPDTAQNSDLGNCEAPPAPGVNWNGCLLGGREYPNLDLAGARLRSADLNAANLRAANLRGSDLAYVNFAGANLRGANLSDTDLLGANLRGADLNNANLQGANLSYAILTDAQRKDADFTGARLDFAEWSPGVQCLANSIGDCVTNVR